jgi:hypothetical protein
MSSLPRTAAAVALVASLTLVGCSSFADYEPVTGEGSSTTTSSFSTSSTPTSSPPATTTAAALPGPGTEVPTEFGSVTYFGQQRPAASNAPAPQQAGTEWVAIDVQLCVDADFPAGGGNIFNSAWTVTDSGDGQIQPSGETYTQFPTPAYPVADHIDAGSCVRGWIVYPVVVGSDLHTVRYLPSIATAPLATWTA